MTRAYWLWMALALLVVGAAWGQICVVLRSDTGCTTDSECYEQCRQEGGSHADCEI